MLSPRVRKQIEALADEMAGLFTPPELIAGCEVLAVDDKDQYASDNGWIEARVGQHNRQRCRWRGQFYNVEVGDFVDVLFFASYRLFVVFGQGGTGAAAGPLAHNLLSANHPDTLAASPPAAGDLITGDDTPQWARLARGSSGQYVTPNNTTGELEWRDIPTIGITEFLYDVASDIATYSQMTPDVPTGGDQTIVSAAVSADDTLIFNLATNANSPGVDFINDGVWHLHLHAQKSGPGTKDVQLKFRVYYRTDPGGVETQIGTGYSESTANLTTSEAEYDLHLALDELAVDLTDRIVLKIYADVSGAGGDPTVTVTVEGDTDARLEIPAVVASGGGGWPFANVLTVSTTDPNADYTTLTAAIAAASAGDAILLDIESSAETVTVNKAIYIIGLARGGTVFTNSITITEAARLYNIKVEHTAAAARGFICNQTGVAVLWNCEAVTSGSTTSRAIEQTNSGSTQVYGGYYESSGAGTSFEVFVSAGLVVLYNQPVLFTGAISGNAAGQYTTSGGDLFFVNGTGMSGGVWLYKTGGTRDYYTSLTLAAAAAGAGDIIHLFPGTYTLTSQLAYGAAFAIEGEGPETIINCATNSISLLLLNSAGAALRNLKITHSGAGILNSGVYITANATVENVIVTLSGAATANYPILQQGGTATLTNVTATASGATTNHAYRNDTGDATATINGGSFSGAQLDIYGERAASFLNIYGALLAHNTVSYTGAVERSGNTSFERGRPNPVINGSFLVWQRGTSFAAIANAAYSADGWSYGKNGAMVHTVSQSSDAPAVTQAGMLVPYSLLVDCTTIDGAIAAGDFAFVRHKVEGFNFLHLAQRQFTLSFWVKATKTGTYCVAFSNSGTDRTYVAEYTVITTNTWEYKTVTVSASPSAGTWDYTTGIGLSVTFTLATGSTYQTTANAWQTGGFLGTSNQVNACDDAANNFQLALVKLEPGAIATPFILPDREQERGRCYRYAYVLDATNTVNQFQGAKTATAVINMLVPAPVPMRIAPTLSHNITGYTAGAPGTTTVALVNYAVNNFFTITGALTVALSNANIYFSSVEFTAGTSWSGTAGDLATLRVGPSVVAVLSAEL